jgi:hypothetical protein
MKLNKYVGLALGLIALSSSASATVTLNGQYGQAFNVDGTTTVPDGTLWALVVDSNADSTMAGVGLNSSLSQVFASGQAGKDLINSTFGGKTFSIGSNFGLDTVFALGGFNSSAVGVAGAAATAVAGLTLGTNGLAQGANYSFFFFPGVIFTTEGAQYTVGGSVGGVNLSTADAGAGTAGMVIPADGATVFQGANTGGDLGGSVPNSSFAAVPLVPEPSSALLGAIGALGLLRRRRN